MEKLVKSNPQRVLVVGGRQRRGGNPEGYRYEAGVICELELPEGRCRQVFEYQSPPDCLPADGGSILFKAASLVEQKLLVCTTTEVFSLSLDDFSISDYISFPCFNDVHYVRPGLAGGLEVVSTGIDSIVSVNQRGEIVSVKSANDPPEIKKFDPQKDYRRIASTKPHQSHPNFLFVRSGKLWVTRFEQYDAIALDGSGRLGPFTAPPHDGVSWLESTVFTTVNGNLVFAPDSSDEPSALEYVDLNRGDSIDGSGWCRGIVPLNDNLALIGFSRIRTTRVKENLKWLVSRVAPTRAPMSGPTRVALFSREHGGLVTQFDLEPSGLDAIFSIHVLGN